jgi:ArsR family transcriptional regulator
MREKLLRAYRERARILKALAHPSRLIMIETMIDDGEICVGDLVEMVGSDQSTVSKHLALLEAAGLVDHRKEGRRIFYRSALPGLVDLLDCLEGVVADESSP